MEMIHLKPKPREKAPPSESEQTEMLDDAIKSQIEAIVKQQLLAKEMDSTQNQTNSMFKDISRIDKSKMNMTDTRFLQQQTHLEEDDVKSLGKSFKSMRSHRSGKSGKTIFTSRNRAG